MNPNVALLRFNRRSAEEVVEEFFRRLCVVTGVNAGSRPIEVVMSPISLMVNEFLAQGAYSELALTFELASGRWTLKSPIPLVRFIEALLQYKRADHQVTLKTRSWVPVAEDNHALDGNTLVTADGGKKLVLSISRYSVTFGGHILWQADLRMS